MKAADDVFAPPSPFLQTRLHGGHGLMGMYEHTGTLSTLVHTLVVQGSLSLHVC